MNIVPENNLYKSLLVFPDKFYFHFCFHEYLISSENTKKKSLPYFFYLSNRINFILQYTQGKNIKQKGFFYSLFFMFSYFYFEKENEWINREY